MSTQEAITEPAVEPVVEPTGATPEIEPLGEPGLAALKSEREARKLSDKTVTELTAKIKEFQDRDKSETEKQSERLAEIQRENAELKSAKTRAEVAEAKSDPAKGIIIPASMLTGSTQEELEASADALIAFKGEKQATRLHIPNEGNSPTVQTGDDEFVRQLFGKD